MKLPELQQKTVITMLRALASAILIAVVAIALGAPSDLAANLSLIVCGTIWFTWPVLRRLPRLAKATRRGARRIRSGAPARTPVTQPAAEPALTQVNHHHHYYAPPPGYGYPPGPGYHGLPSQPLAGQRALPRYSQQRLIHDQIYSAVDPTIG